MTKRHAREVCLKHRKNRREMIPAGVSSNRADSGVCSFCRYMRRGCVPNRTRAAHLRSSSKSKMPERHSGDAGASPADRTIFRNPFIETQQRVRRAPACAAESPKLRGLGAAPRRRATFQIAGEPGGKAAAS